MATAQSAAPIEALIVDQNALIRALQITLEELHARRRLTPQLTGELDLGYVEAVFSWIKGAHCKEFVVMERVDGR